MNRQLIFLVGVFLVILPWPQIGIPMVFKSILIALCGLMLIFQAMKRSARTNATPR